MVQASNRKRYFSSKVLPEYTTYNLMRAEARVLLKYQPYFFQKDVLDIGIGAGRTAVYLAPLARKYVGIDFSPMFIEFVNSTMPAVSAMLADMRDLSDFENGQFDFVMASFNVIDFVTHRDRLVALAEVNRVLKPGGIFIFSSHNRAFEATGRRPTLERTKDPVRQVVRVQRWIWRTVNYLKLKKHCESNSEYEIVTDIGNDFSTLHYYIDQDSQRQQLFENGYSVVEVCDINGNPLEAGEVDRKSPFLTYVVRKPVGEDRAID